MSSGIKFPLSLSSIPENIWINFNIIPTILGGPDLTEKGHTLHGASIPVDLIPTNVTCVGPMVLDSAPVAEQDADMAAWLAKVPTILINLGSIWKLKKFNKFTDYSDDHLTPVKPFIEKARLMVVDWLDVDPPSMLNSGHVLAFVHHGGFNCYHETVL
ncbi:unnamed protein product [Clonostachys byssicola]|uniref:Uncharacterized protein n=1 Tax=Clonostachys byssicola TaxID=160290 RepID=A0A9N9Y7Z9_9HYPO|nr:unnamed protein product [Clonostachys byssicola]